MSTVIRGVTSGMLSKLATRAGLFRALRCLFAAAHCRTRFGLLLEDLDSLAGNVAFAHCDDGDPSTPAPLLVTASVDHLVLRQRLSMAATMNLRGRTM